MTDLDEKIAISQWLQFKSSAEHYEMLQAQSERGTHPDAPYFAIHWRSLAQQQAPPDETDTGQHANP